MASRNIEPAEAQDDVVAAAEEKGKGLRLTLSKTQQALAHLHEVMIPGADIPEDLESLVNIFHSNDEAIKGFSYMQTKRGARAYLSRHGPWSKGRFQCHHLYFSSWA